MGRLGDRRRARGSEFQIVGAAKENERFPSSVFMKGVLRRCWEDERRDLVGLCKEMSSCRYSGCLKCRVLKVRVAILKVMRSLMGSQ